MARFDKETYEIVKRLQNARLSLMETYPFYALLLINMKFAIDLSCETTYTDGYRIAFNPDFINELSDSELVFVLMHEVLHAALGHPFRHQPDYETEIFDIACDIVVNSNIYYSCNKDKKFISLKKYGESMHLAPNGKEGYLYTAEEVYSMLLDQHNIKPKKQNNAANSQGASSGGNSNANSDNTEDTSDNNSLKDDCSKNTSSSKNSQKDKNDKKDQSSDSSNSQDASSDENSNENSDNTEDTSDNNSLKDDCSKNTSSSKNSQKGKNGKNDQSSDSSEDGAQAESKNGKKETKASKDESASENLENLSAESNSENSKNGAKNSSEKSKGDISIDNKDTSDLSGDGAQAESKNGSKNSSKKLKGGISTDNDIDAKLNELVASMLKHNKAIALEANIQEDELKEEEGNKESERFDDHDFWEGDDECNSGKTTWLSRMIEATDIIESLESASNDGTFSSKGGKCRGTTPLGAKRMIDEIKNPILDWRTILIDFIQEDICDYSFAPPDKRMDDCPFFLPDFNEKDQKAENILFMIDTSASMSDTEITQCYSEIYHAIGQFNGKLTGKLGFFDAVIIEPIEFQDEDDFKIIRPKGGGGTSFDIIFKHVQENMLNDLPASIVILTDGGAPFPDESEALGIPVLWIINNKDITPPWGKIARLIEGHAQDT